MVPCSSLKPLYMCVSLMLRTYMEGACFPLPLHHMGMGNLYASTYSFLYHVHVLEPYMYIQGDLRTLTAFCPQTSILPSGQPTRRDNPRGFPLMVLGLMGFQIGQRAYATPSHSSTQWPVVVNTLKYYTYGILFQNRPLICLIPTYLLPAVTETWCFTSPTSNLAHTSTAHVSIKLPHLVFSVSKQ